MSQYGRMASSTNAMKRSSSSASAGVTNYQQGDIMPSRPNTIPLNIDKISKIRPKLATFRGEYQLFHFESGLDERDTNNILAQAIRGRATNNERRPAPRSVSGATDITNDTEGTGVTITWDKKTGLETKEKVKKQLDPLLKARKDLLRSIGTCPDCRAKKVKCFLSHHRLEDLLIEHSDAESDVVWALTIDADPKQAEQNITNSNRRSPTGTLLETFAEESFFGTEGRDPVRQVNHLFGVTNVGLPVYPDLDVEGLSEVRTPNNDFLAAGNMGYDNRFATPAKFPTSSASHDLFGTGSQAQPIMGDNAFEPLSGQSCFSLRQRASSINTRANPRISLVPSVGYQGTCSAPQSASSKPPHYTYSQPDSMAGATQGSFQSAGQSINAFLASFNGQFFKCTISSNITESSLCGRNFADIQQMILHIQQNHTDHSIGTPMLRSVCPICCSYYALTQRMCSSCGQQTQHFICGTSPVYESQLNSPSQSIGGNGLDFEGMSYGFLSTESDAWSNGNGMTSPMSDGRSSNNGCFGDTFGSNFNNSFNDAFDGSMNAYH